MRSITVRTLGLIVAAALVGACGQTDRPDADGTVHHFTDGTVLDASQLDGGQPDAEVALPACSDGVDNDDDGLVDYPEDPGCEDAEDVDESNPPFCGLDSTGEMIEIRTIPPTGHLVQNTENGHEFHEGSCGGAGAPEMVFSFTILGNTAGVQINTDGTPTLLDTVVYVRQGDCDDPAAEVACKATTSGGGVSLDLTDPAPGEYFIFVDGDTPGVSGQFLLEVRGLIPEGSPCDPTDQTLVCMEGLICEEPAPGQPTVCLVPLCSDGIDNDGDGIIDWPNEPGCESPLDHSEDDTCPGAGCPACADGVDNDNDGLTDWPNDPGCTCAGDPIELDECITGLDLTELPATGIDTGTVDPIVPSLTNGSCNTYSAGPETVYPLDLPFGAVELDVTLQMSGYNAYPHLYIRAEECGSGTELGCKGYNYLSSENLSLSNLAPGSYFIFADSYEIWGTDSYTITVEVKLPVGAPCEVGNPLKQCGPGGTCQNTGTAWECVPTICNNGLDDDGDGYTDWPNDPGCTTVDDNDEIDSCDPVNNPAACPVCFNGADDDGDGLIDFPNDPGCTSAADSNELDECYPGVQIEELPPSGTVTGTINPADVSQTQGSCNFATAGPEDVFTLDLPDGAVQLDVDMTVLNWNAYPTLFVRRDDCAAGAEIGCIGNNYNSSEHLTLQNLQPGSYYVFADTYEVWSNDTYNLTVQVQLPGGAACTLGSTLYTCATGYTCADTGGGVYQCVGTACNNGTDDDGDGYTDYPNDPGCTSVADNDELDSCDPVNNPAACPVCFNGADDDGDGLIDFPNDPGCDSAADSVELDECYPGVQIEALPPTGAVTGTIDPLQASQTQGSCNFATPGPEDVYAVELPDGAVQLSATMTVLNYNAYPNIHLRRDTCATGTEVGCVGTNYNGTEQLTAHNLQAGTYFLFADSYEVVTNDTYTMNVQVQLPVGAACTAGNTVFSCAPGSSCADIGGGLYQCVGTACNNGTDDDGDGYTDYPNDPGCTSIADNDELDSCDPINNPGACPACFDTNDNDGDGLSDYPNDPGCSCAADNNELDQCATGVTFTDITSTGYAAGTPTGLDNYTGSCGYTGYPEDVYLLWLTQPVDRVDITMNGIGGDFEPVIHARYGDCDDATVEIGCAAPTMMYNLAELTLFNVAAGHVFIFADANWIDPGTSYTLSLTATLPSGSPCDPASSVILCPTGTTCTDPGTGYVCQ